MRVYRVEHLSDRKGPYESEHRLSTIFACHTDPLSADMETIQWAKESLTKISPYRFSWDTIETLINTLSRYVREKYELYGSFGWVVAEYDVKPSAQFEGQIIYDVNIAQHIADHEFSTFVEQYKHLHKYS